MKFTLVFLTIAVCLFASTQGLRHKRSTAFEMCPLDADCEAYAKKQSEKAGSCTSYATDGKTISYLGCGSVICGENTKGVQDLSKPYPHCCLKCEVIDPSKPANSSGII